MFKKLIQKAGQTASFSQVAKANFSSKAPVRVAVTGAAGQIGYALLFRIASGQMLGADQPVILQLVDLPFMAKSLEGVKMELNDCAFPLVKGIECHTTLAGGFKDTNYALLVGAKPRGPGMERGDLLKDNGKIFIDTGKAINDNSSRDVKVIVVGNPANTNCLIASHYAPDIPKENFTAMTRLDHNRGVYQVAEKLGCDVTAIENYCIWGNHSPTMVPDLTDVTVNGKKIYGDIDKTWQDTYYDPKVQKRGAEIIEARKLSSAASAANAAIEHIRDWQLGAKGWTSMAVPSNGEYGVPKGLIFSFPVTTTGGSYKIVEGIVRNEESFKQKIAKTTNELLEERKAVEDLLK